MYLPMAVRYGCNYFESTLWVALAKFRWRCCDIELQESETGAFLYRQAGG